MADEAEAGVAGAAVTSTHAVLPQSAEGEDGRASRDALAPTALSGPQTHKLICPPVPNTWAAGRNGGNLDVKQAAARSLPERFFKSPDA